MRSGHQTTFCKIKQSSKNKIQILIKKFTDYVLYHKKYIFQALCKKPTKPLNKHNPQNPTPITSEQVEKKLAGVIILDCI